MRRTALLIMWGTLALAQAGSCPEACRDFCGTEKSCCRAKSKRCTSVQLERGGDPSSAYASKGGLRLR